MRRLNRPRHKWDDVVFLLVCTLVLFADQLSKIWIRANLPIGQSLFEIGFFRVIHIQNTGAAFGIFPDQPVALTIISFIGAIALVLCALLSRRCLPFLDNMLGKSALGLVLGGTIGNLIDRFRFSYVTDFLDFGFWPTFNIADSAVTIGVIIFAYYLFRLAQTARG
ncbi:signal peptidase II [Chloroflexota bacterium]